MAARAGWLMADSRPQTRAGAWLGAPGCLLLRAVASCLVRTRAACFLSPSSPTMAGAVCVPSRLSTWLWQPEGLD
eukprot:COSAG01_NODE_19493_length_1006_cov_4.233738_1_plen_74_part_10